MHQVLRIPEILLNIFGHCYTELIPKRRNSVDLAVLARTCQTFKEPALDVLWEELYGLSPLARCLPEACYVAKPAKKLLGCLWNMPRYSFSRPLKEAEWITLRSYARRVRSIRCSSVDITMTFIRVVFSLVPFDNPLFPHLRSLYWDGTATSALSHIVAPSLKILHFNFMPRHPTYTEPFSFNDLGDCFRRIESLDIGTVYSGPMDLAISDLVCRWPKLQRVACSNVALNMNAISHLSSVPSLKSLKFKAGTVLVQDISHINSKLLFSSLTFLEITSTFLDIITSLLRYIRLPAIKSLSVVAQEGRISRRAVQLYWAAVREVCQSNVLTYLALCGSSGGEEEEEIPPHEEQLSSLTLDVLRPCTAFANLRGLDVDFGCSVSLTDADLLDLVSPCMEYLLINYERGWQIDADSGGITLSGLVQLLRKCPSLNRLCLVIDTQTFTEIPEGLDVSFPARRQLEINLADSYILPEFVPGFISVFTALGLDPFLVSTGLDLDDCEEESRLLWGSVLDALRDMSA